MKNNRNRFASACLIALSLTTAAAGATGTLEQVGTSMANFLKVGVGARAAGMGDAYVAVCEDASALYWNPGGLDRMQQNEVLFQQNQWLVDTKIYFVGAGYRLPGIGTVGLSAHFFTSGEIEETTLQQPDGTGRTFTAQDFALGVAFSRRITDRFSTGVQVKYIQEALSLEKASTLAIDIGSVFVTNFLNNLRVGMALSNLGGKMKLSGSDLSVQYSVNPDYPTKIIRADLTTEEWDIPLCFRFGLATNLLKQPGYRWTVAGEIMDSRDFIHRLAVGSELAFWEKVFLRSGYKFNTDEDSFTLGAGLNYQWTGLNCRLDYAFVRYGVFDNTQRFSFIFGF
jgi:long-subunit fatty acid transport protein